ncbi:hypothetical protein EDB19DRAFT_1964800 [Suillus lakei]|nr:hypothetical protein EDB19DRAFT_1964800 [Suillus lakei]
MKTHRALLIVVCEDSEDGSEEDENEECDSEYEDWLCDSMKACVSQIEKEMDFERFYGLGYKIPRRPRAPVCDADAFEKEFIEGIPLPDLPTRNGWQSVCRGYFDESNGNYDKKWCRAELGKMELYEEAVMDLYETLFGDLEKPAATDPEAMLAHRRSLVRGIRLLLVAAGISYDIACADDEFDKQPRQLMLEGLTDKCVGRGIRNACGLQLTRDAEEEREGVKKRRKAAKGYNSYNDSEDELSALEMTTLMVSRRKRDQGRWHEEDLQY